MLSSSSLSCNSGACIGRVKKKVVPLSISLSTQMRPPCASIKLRAMVRPSPLPPVAWLLFFTAVIWALIYDTMYAMVDRRDDRAAGIKSTAILFGRFDRLAIGLLQILMLTLLWQVGQMAGRGAAYLVELTGAGDELRGLPARLGLDRANTRPWDDEDFQLF